MSRFADAMPLACGNFELLTFMFVDVDFQHSNLTPDDAVHIQISFEKRRGCPEKVRKGEDLDEALVASAVFEFAPSHNAHLGGKRA